MVAPYAGAWIEISHPPHVVQLHTSPLTQGRGLKYHTRNRFNDSGWSPLTQGRGLKYYLAVTGWDKWVAPYAGAWIEIFSPSIPIFGPMSPLTQGRGLKSHHHPLPLG